MKAQFENERKKLLASIEKLLEGPMIFLGFVWLALLIAELIWGLSKALEYLSIAIFGYVTATLASFFIGRDAEEKDAPLASTKDIEELKNEIAALTKAIDEVKSKWK